MQLADVWAGAWRTAIALVVLLVSGVASLLLGLGAQPFAWIVAPALLSALAVATVWVLWRGRGERRRVALVAAVLATVVGVLVWAASPAGHRLLSWRLDDIGLPPDARLATEDASGNVLCFDDCPSVSRTYRVDGDHREVAERMETSLARSGLSVTREGPDGISFSNATDADIDLAVDIRPSSRHPATELNPEPRAIPGTTVIELRATARQGRF